jgi:cytosine/adenosine deaminase-related metal-dependent hydrolase
MQRDSRYQAARWLERNRQPGDTLGYYGARFKLPRLRRDLLVTPAPDQYLPAELYGARGPVTRTPQFILVIPQLLSEPVHEWSLPDSVFRGLMDGSLGYDQVLAIQTPAIFPRPLRVAPAVNPPLRLFARQDVATRLPGPVRVELPDPSLGLGPRRLDGQARRVLRGATLLDGTGAEPLAASRIVIEAGRFACVSGPEGCPSRPGDQERTLLGKWITPGLIDTHVHLPFAVAPAGLPRLQRLRFALGITTVRDAGSRSIDELLAAREDAESASRPTPRIVVAARIVPEDAERLGVRLGAPLVKRLAEKGVDAIKLKEPFDGELWREEIRAASGAGIPVFGHTWGGPPSVEFTRAAIAAGINGISHLGGIALAGQPPGTDLTPPDSAADIWAWHKRLWLTAEPAALDSLISEMVSRRVWLEPTLATEFYWGRAIEPPGEVPYLRPPPRLREILLHQAPPSHPPGPAYSEPWARQLAFVGEFIRRGGGVIAGSDGLEPGLDLHEEIRLIGLAAGSPMMGLLAATRNAAAGLGRADLGTIEVGKVADAVIYSTDPLGAPRATLQVLAVVKGGVVYEVDTLSAEFRHEYDARVREAWHGRIMRGLKLLGVVAAAAILLLVWLRRRRRR